jgi:hypothetical protein
MDRRRSVVAAVVSVAVTVGSVVASPERVSAQSEPVWLTVVNRYRALSGLDPVVENPDASTGSLRHSSYLHRNRIIGHDEDSADLGYSDEGRRAGLSGNVATGFGRTPDDRAIVEGWMAVPFHGIGILGPSFKRFGYGRYAAKNSWAATLSLFWDERGESDEVDTSKFDALFDAAIATIRAQFPNLESQGWSASMRGSRVAISTEGRTFVVEGTVVTEVPGGASPDVVLATTSTPRLRTIVWPGDSTGVPLVRYSGSEYPDPLTSCPGYRSPVGLPLYIARGRDTELASVSLTDDRGKSFTSCVLSAATFRNPDPVAQQLGRAVLGGYGAVSILPRKPLEFGRTYRVDVVTTDGERIGWSFRTTVDEIVAPADSPLANQPTPGRSSQRPTASKTKR